MIQLLYENVTKPALNREQIERWLKVVAATHHKKVSQLNYLFCDNERMLQINREFLQHDYYTDIITFDTGRGRMVSGDIYISLEMVTSNAEELNAPFFEELCRVIVHGLLHLCGFNDADKKEEEEMRREEDKALELLRAMES